MTAPLRLGSTRSSDCCRFLVHKQNSNNPSVSTPGKGLCVSPECVPPAQCCLICSAQEITQEYLNRLQTAEPEVQSFISIASESACAAARALDDRIASDGMDSLGPLAAVPLGIKVWS